jgi:hypothetical protein
VRGIFNAFSILIETSVLPMTRQIIFAANTRTIVHGTFKMLLTMKAVASKIWYLCHGSGGMVLSFWKDLNGGSPARTECQNLLNSWPREVASILSHVAAVEAVGHTNNNGHLAQAQAYPARPLPIGFGQIYWWEVNRVGAFYAYDGKDMVVVLMDRVSNPPTFGDLLSLAQGRV